MTACNRITKGSWHFRAGVMFQCTLVLGRLVLYQILLQEAHLSVLKQEDILAHVLNYKWLLRAICSGSCDIRMKCWLHPVL